MPSGQETSAVSKQATMDVDAFKRMLLTGSRENAVSRVSVVPNPQTVTIQSISDSSSSADTASLFETAPATHEESPRTSDDWNAGEAVEQRASLGPAFVSKKAPPPPKARRGKALKEPADEESRSSATFDNFISSLSVPNVQSTKPENASPMSPNFDPSSTSDRGATFLSAEAQQRTPPPPPPLARRKGQQPPTKPVLTRSTSSRHSVLSDFESPPSPSYMGSSSKAPPPPPSRRSTSTGERRPSIDAISVGGANQLPAESAATEPRPSLLQTPSYQKRMSQGAPPPLPPPRRGRESSRSSIDTQRPPMAALWTTEGAQSESLVRTDSADMRDILADLAALQEEVDAARANSRQ